MRGWSSLDSSVPHAHAGPYSLTFCICQFSGCVGGATGLVTSEMWLLVTPVSPVYFGGSLVMSVRFLSFSGCFRLCFVGIGWDTIYCVMRQGLRQGFRI